MIAQRPPKLRLVILLSVALLVAGMIAWGTRNGGRSDTKNVVFIVIDTLRADHLPFYGYERDTAPYLSSIAKQSVLFERAFATSSWTAPAMASIFTSSYPSDHGVVLGFVAHRNLTTDGVSVTLGVLRKEQPTLGEIFRSGGYRTFGVADNINISDAMGFSRGFDKFSMTSNQGADRVNATVRSWAAEIRDSGPYLLYLHYMDVHEPYEGKAPWYVESEDPLRRTVNAYDSEIAYVDEKIREVSELLDWNDETIIVVLADHGEELGDHGSIGHGRNLFTEVLHVPFFVKVPGVAPRRLRDEVNTIDLLPTLVEMLDLPVSERTRLEWRGVSLFPSIVDGSAVGPRRLFAELLRTENIPPGAKELPEVRSVIAAPHHLIDERSDGKILLFDLEKDFGETENIAARDPETVEILKGALRDLIRRPGIEAEIELDREAIEHLRSLGYVR